MSNPPAASEAQVPNLVGQGSSCSEFSTLALTGLRLRSCYPGAAEDIISMHGLLIRFAIGTLLALALVIVTPRSPRAGENEAKGLIAMIDGGVSGNGGFGAGIIVGSAADRLYIATADHVVRQGPNRLDRVRVRLISPPGQVLEAEVLSHFDRDLDLAVLSVAGIEGLGIELDGIPLQQLGSPDRLVRGDEVYSIGNPRGMAWQVNVNPDRISRKDVLNLAFESVLIAKGHSGGGLFNKNWALVGMITADQHPNGIALRIDRILEKMNEWGYPVALNAAPEPERAAPSTTLSILSSKSGHAWSYPRTSPSWKPVPYYGYRIGVTHTEDLPPAGESLSVFSFDVSPFRGKRILRADLDLTPTDTIGDPYGTLGSLVIDHISFGDLSQVLSASALEQSHVLLDPPQGPVDVTHQVKTSIETGSRNVQFRMRFSAARMSNIDEALSAENAYLYWAHGPELTVYLEE